MLDTTEILWVIRHITYRRLCFFTNSINSNSSSSRSVIKTGLSSRSTKINMTIFLSVLRHQWLTFPAAIEEDTISKASSSEYPRSLFILRQVLSSQYHGDAQAPCPSIGKKPGSFSTTIQTRKLSALPGSGLVSCNQ